MQSTQTQPHTHTHTHTHIYIIRKVGTIKPVVKYLQEEYIHKSDDVAKQMQ
jgi:hypothetical protein